MTGSKSDLYLKDKISEEEARKFANEINAVFKLTSAMNNQGIDELFEELAVKYYENQENIIKNENKDKRFTLENNNIDDVIKKKKCC